MKDIYINSRLHPLLMGRRRLAVPPVWLFSRGEPWLLLTPPRLATLAERLGLRDARVYRLLSMVKRHAFRPEAFCRRLGVEEIRQSDPDTYPFALCPRCDSVHHPHPEDADLVCGQCRERERREARTRPAGGEIRDRRRDRAARADLLEKHPGLFDDGTLSPNHQYNRHRRLVRDWEKATNRILHGHTYKQVAKEFNCSVGLLHRRVKERKHWENN